MEISKQSPFCHLATLAGDGIHLGNSSGGSSSSYCINLDNLSAQS